MAVLLLRHGETALNAARVMQPADTPLSERGQAQARAVAQRLVDSKVAVVIGHYNSGTSIPASKIYSDAGLPQVVVNGFWGSLGHGCSGRGAVLIATGGVVLVDSWRWAKG